MTTVRDYFYSILKEYDQRQMSDNPQGEEDLEDIRQELVDTYTEYVKERIVG